MPNFRPILQISFQQEGKKKENLGTYLAIKHVTVQDETS